MILDSTFIHDVIREDNGAVNRLVELVEAETAVTISALTVFEVGVGLRGESTRYRARFDEQMDDLTVVPLRESDARCALSIQHTLLDRGEPIGARDVLIAGTALESADPRILTRNVAEFERVDGLDVITY
jgi:predicted nucleic acid-binding protein